MSEIRSSANESQRKQSPASSKRVWSVVYFLIFGTVFCCSGGMSVVSVNLVPEAYDIYGSRALPLINILVWIGLILSVPFAVVAIGLLFRQQWAVTVGKVLCILLMITGFPVGTLVFGIGYSLIKDLQFAADGSGTVSSAQQVGEEKKQAKIKAKVK